MHKQKILPSSFESQRKIIAVGMLKCFKRDFIEYTFFLFLLYVKVFSVRIKGIVMMISMTFCRQGECYDDE